MHIKFPCYLRFLRRSSALTQPEIAAILGLSQQHISKIERVETPPNAAALIGCEVLFGKPASAAFPKFYDEVEDRVIRSVYEFQEVLTRDSSAEAERKRSLLSECLSRAVTRVHLPQQDHEI